MRYLSIKNPLATLVVALLSTLAFAEDIDRIEMKNGDVYRGEIIEQKFGEYIQIRFKDGNEKMLPFADIAATAKEQPESKAPTPQEPTPAPIVAAPSAVSADPRKPMTIWIYGLRREKNEISYVLEHSSGSYLAGGDEDLPASNSFGAQLEYFERPYLSIVGGAEFTKIGKTSITNILGGGRIRLPSQFSPWMGLGTGFSLVSLGGATSTTIDGVSVSIDRSTIAAMGRLEAGADANFGPASVSVFGAFSFMAPQFTLSASNGSSSEDFNLRYSMTFWTYGVRVGIPF